MLPVGRLIFRDVLSFRGNACTFHGAVRAQVETIQNSRFGVYDSDFRLRGLGDSGDRHLHVPYQIAAGDKAPPRARLSRIHPSLEVLSLVMRPLVLLLLLLMRPFVRYVAAFFFFASDWSGRPT